MNIVTLDQQQLELLQPSEAETLNKLLNPLKIENLPAIASLPNRPVTLDFDESFDLPEIDYECLPMWLSGYLYTISVQNQVPPDVMTILGLDILSCCLQKKFVVSPYDDNHQIEHLNLWTLIASDLGNKKAILDTLIRPITEWEKEQVDKVAAAQISREVFQDFSKRTASLIVNKAARIEADDLTRSITSRGYVNFADNHEPERLLYEAEQAKARAPKSSPAPQTIIANHVTQKSLPAELVASYGKLALISEDSSLVKIMNSRNFLDGHSGGPQRIRLGKRDVFLNEVSTAVGLIVSTDKLKELFNSRQSNSQEFLAKSLFCLSNPITGRRNIRESQIDPDLTQFAKQAYDYGIGYILDLSRPAILDKTTGRYLPKIIRLTDEALEVWLQFREWLESESGENGKFEHLQGWTDNLPGVFGKLNWGHVGNRKWGHLSC